jgi:hypothetical protein
MTTGTGVAAYQRFHLRITGRPELSLVEEVAHRRAVIGQEEALPVEAELVAHCTSIVQRDGPVLVGAGHARAALELLVGVCRGLLAGVDDKGEDPLDRGRRLGRSGHRFEC